MQNSLAKPETKMKASTKLLISGLLTVLAVILAGTIFDGLGVLFGPEAAGMSGIAGLIASFRLLSGT
jgi:hypothetical protein